jgi:hypothetical protein
MPLAEGSSRRHYVHTLDTQGEGVRRYYPRWYRGPKTGTEP